MISPISGTADRSAIPVRQRADRPALTALALLAVANPAVAERLLINPMEAASAHPHYLVHLDDEDQVVLASVRSSARSVREFLIHLADAIDAVYERTLTPASD